MKIKTLTSFIVLLAYTVLFVDAADAAAPDQKGFDIAARSDRTDVGFGASEVDLKMVLRNAAGQEASRSLRISTLQVTSNGAVPTVARVTTASLRSP